MVTDVWKRTRTKPDTIPLHTQHAETNAAMIITHGKTCAKPHCAHVGWHIFIDWLCSHVHYCVDLGSFTLKPC